MQVSRPHVSKVQKECMLKYLQENPRLTNIKFSASFNVKDAQMLWRSLAASLNRLPGRGSVKSWKQWRKTWQDLKSKTKMKYFQENGVLTKEEILILKISGELNGNQLPTTEMNIKSELDGDKTDINEFIILNENSTLNYEEKPNNEHLHENILIQIIPSTPEENANQVNDEDDEFYETIQNEDAEMMGEESNDMNDIVRDNVHLKRPDKNTQCSKGSYYERKIYYLNRIARAKERSASAKVRIANALEKIAASRTNI
ncbi:hypothetical protein JTB14_016291 [Gonioctena quinquepunctata]|nr:hypothetical protein JTB14_016291 [Gonioctena quinquepunctata]